MHSCPMVAPWIVSCYGMQLKGRKRGMTRVPHGGSVARVVRSTRETYELIRAKRKNLTMSVSETAALNEKMDRLRARLKFFGGTGLGSAVVLPQPLAVKGERSCRQPRPFAFGEPPWAESPWVAVYPRTVRYALGASETRADSLSRRAEEPMGAILRRSIQQTIFLP